jgi:hypothetical protein
MNLEYPVNLQKTDNSTYQKLIDFSLDYSIPSPDQVSNMKRTKSNLSESNLQKLRERT